VKCLPAGIVFTHGPIFRFFAPQGRHVAPIKLKFGREERTSLPNYTLIGSGCGFTAPKTLKIWNFTNIIAHKGRVPCTNSYKIYRVYARP